MRSGAQDPENFTEYPLASVPLNSDELAEYAELGAAYRNDDNIGLATGALLLPVAFGSVAG